MSKHYLRLKAFALRKKGESIGSIARQLQISKSTASAWCEDLPLTSSQQKRLIKKAIEAGQKGRLMGAEMNRQKKVLAVNAAFERAKNEISKISRRDLLIAATALYWGEGSKSSQRSGFLFVNSDPNAILLIKMFLKRLLGIVDKDISCVVQINAIHKSRIEEVLRFWSKKLNLPRGQFGNPYYVHIRPKKVYENYNTYYGILRMRVKRSSNLKYYVLGLIEALKNANLSG